MSQTAYATIQSKNIDHLRLDRRQDAFKHINQQQALLEIKMILTSGVIVTSAILMVSILT